QRVKVVGPVSDRDQGVHSLLAISTGGQDGAKDPAQRSGLAGPGDGLWVLPLTLGLGDGIEQAAQPGLGLAQYSPGLHAMIEDRIGRAGSFQLTAESFQQTDLLRIELDGQVPLDLKQVLVFDGVVRSFDSDNDGSP